MPSGKVSRSGSSKPPSQQGGHGLSDQSLPGRSFPLPRGYYEYYGIRPPEPAQGAVQAKRSGLNQGPYMPRGLLERYGLVPRAPAEPLSTASIAAQPKAETQTEPTQAAEPETRAGDATSDPAPVETTTVQTKSSGAAPQYEAGRVHEAAARGTSGAGGPLPYLNEIQRSFGNHDVSRVNAHIDGPAAEGTRAMGAEAFAMGHHVAFARPPSLHTAAHEAAHVIQQRSGVQLKGGVGEVGDRYEQHADAVADLVVQGKSSEALLDAVAPSGSIEESSPDHHVQREVVVPPSESQQQSTNSPPPPPSGLDALIAAVEQAAQDEEADRTSEAKKGNAKHHQEIAKARQEAVKVLTEWCRDHLPDRAQLDAYLTAPGDSKEQKIQTIGQLVVAVARMEFLLGWMYEGGIAPGRNWESQGADKGEYVTHYQKEAGTSKTGGLHWCTSFAGYCYKRLGIDETLTQTKNQVFASGYRLRWWATKGQNIDKKQITDEDKILSTLSGAAFIDQVAWRQLVKELRSQVPKNKKGASQGTEASSSVTSSEAKATPASIVDDFFATHPGPQPGDIAVLGVNNDFKKKGTSHTVLIERYDSTTHTLWTIEGNATGAVRARQLILTNPDHVAQIICWVRPGLEHYNVGTAEVPVPSSKEPPQQGQQGPGDEVDAGGATKASNAALLTSMQEVIEKLTKLAADHNWIKSADAGASTLEWLTGAKSDKTGGATLGTQ
jgi:hypothetical protein